MTKKYIIRLLTLHELDIPIDDNIEYLYKYFLKLFYSDCIVENSRYVYYYKSEEVIPAFSYNKYENIFSINNKIGNIFMELWSNNFHFEEKTIILKGFLEYHTKKECLDFHYH